MAEVDTERCRGLSTEGRVRWQAGARADPHYHIVTTFESKESGAPGVLAQSLGISGRLEWLSEVCVLCIFQCILFIY